MDAKTPEKLLKGVDVSELAIGISVNAQIGPNRTISMTLGAPMAMTLADLNAYVDKIMAVADRQNNIGILEQTKLALAAAEKNIHTNREQRATLEGKFMLDWTISKRKGDFVASSAQNAQLNNYDITIRNLKDEVIPKLRRDIMELEHKIAQGV